MTTLLIWLLLLLQGICLGVAVFFLVRLILILFHWKQHLPFVPSSRRFQRAVIAGGWLKDAQTVVDLGCGTGTLLAAFQTIYPQTQFRGVEYNRFLARLARLRFRGRKHCTITHGDMFDADISDADVIVGFWISDFMPRLAEKFVKECTPGCLIISNTFSLPDIPGITLLHQEQLKWGKFSVYRVGGGSSVGVLQAIPI
jgi:SAM-dependent methyltransferase